MENELPYRINDADNHFNEPGDCFERYIDPKDKDLAIRQVTAPDGKKMMLFAGKPSKFHMRHHVLSERRDREAARRHVGPRAHRGRMTPGGSTRRRRIGSRVRVPGMLLTRLNPLKDLTDEERRGVHRGLPQQGRGVRQPRPAPRVDGRAGHRQGAHVPGRGARHRVRVRRQHRRAVRQHPRLQPLDARRGRLRRGAAGCSSRPTSRSPIPSWR